MEAASANFVGGLVGSNNGDVTASFATAPLETSGVTNGGGFVGRNGGTISDVYATGDVTGGPNRNNIGGFVGENRDTIETAFATGAVSGSDVGGFAGNSSGTEIDCYWDTPGPPDSTPPPAAPPPSPPIRCRATVRPSAWTGSTSRTSGRP